MSENNVEPTIPINSETIPVHILDNYAPVCITQILVDMNHMYQITIDVKQEVLNTQSRFNKKI